MKRTVLVAVAALLVGVGCGGDEPVEEAGQALPVTVVRVDAVTLSERIEATGELVAVDHAEIAAEIEGRVTEILAEDGSAVAAGDPVLAIDPERRSLALASARARVEEARAQVGEKRREVRRVKELRGRKVVSQTQLEEAETELVLAESRLSAAEAELGTADRALRDATVRAPFAGQIAERFVSRGEYVSQGQRLFDLVSVDPIEVEFHLTEADSGRAALGQTVDIRVAPFPDEVFQGTVTVVSPTIDEQSRTLRVKAHIDNSDGRLRPGLFARIDLGVATRSGVVMVPEEAVLQRADGSVVYRVAPDDRVERVVVETGLYQDGRVEVVRGVAAGDQLVTRGQFRLIDGQRVAIRTPDGAPVGGAIPDLAETSR
jgi:membrane fusion protein (multidrug efflux system)